MESEAKSKIGKEINKIVKEDDIFSRPRKMIKKNDLKIIDLLIKEKSEDESHFQTQIFDKKSKN